MSELTREAVQRAVDEIRRAREALIAVEAKSDDPVPPWPLIEAMTLARDAYGRVLRQHGWLLFDLAERALAQQPASRDEYCATYFDDPRVDGGWNDDGTCYAAGFEAGAASRLLLPPTTDQAQGDR